MTKCHFCDKELPEPPSKHTIYAAGTLHRAPSGEPMPYYPVCFACLKFHKLQPRELKRELSD
jgi:hypothetical protein